MKVKTSYIEIEELIVSSSKVTMECNLMLSGKNYSEAIPTNVISTLTEFLEFLKHINDDISNKILRKINSIKNSLNDNERINIKLSDYIKTKWWSVKINLTLNPIILADGYIIFYEFININIPVKKE